MPLILGGHSIKPGIIIETQTEVKMNNTWIVAPVRDNSVDLSGFVSKLTGGFTIPETYEKQTFNAETQSFDTENVPHPHFGKTLPDFSGRIVFVNTTAGYAEFDGVTNVEDFGDVNIARWMNAGINHAVANGADKVVVLSNPVNCDLSVLFDADVEADSHEVVNIADGVMFVLSGSSEFRLDEQFKIWFWADDFYRRVAEVCGGARNLYGNLEELIPFIVDTPENEAIVKEDETKYNTKWS